jgi:hypothetical protein
MNTLQQYKTVIIKCSVWSSVTCPEFQKTTPQMPIVEQVTSQNFSVPKSIFSPLTDSKSQRPPTYTDQFTFRLHDTMPYLQTRIILNKADQVRPEELMRVQGTLIWNISPLMSSSEPPVMYSTSLWSLPYEAGAPTRLLLAQERAFLRDFRDAIDKRVENKIASARRFAVSISLLSITTPNDTGVTM